MALVRFLAALMTLGSALMVWISLGFLVTHVDKRRRARGRMTKEEFKAACPYPKDALAVVILNALTAVIGIITLIII